MYSGKYNIMLNFQPPSFSESTVKNGYNLLWSFVHDTALNILNEAYLVSQVNLHMHKYYWSLFLPIYKS